MIVRPIHFLTLAGLLAGPAAPVHYRVELVFTQVVDPSSLGGQIQTTGGTVVGFVNLVERDTLGGHLAEFRFDSIIVAPGDNLPPNLLGDASTAKAVIYRSMIVNGRPAGGFKTLQTETRANLFVGAFDAIFPGFRASAKTGDKWVDTMSVKDTIPVVREGTTVTAWTASALSGGMLTIDGTSTGTGRAVQMTGNGQMVASSVLSGSRQLTGPPGGAAIKGTITAKQELNLSIENLPAFPGTVEQRVTITRLP